MRRTVWRSAKSRASPVVDETVEDGMSPVPEVIKVAERLRESARAKNAGRDVSSVFQEVVQLPLWEERVRGLPNSFARSALFTSANRSVERENFKRRKIATLRGVKAAKEGLDAVILSPTAVIGPYDYRSSLLGQALIKIHQNRLPFLISGGYNWVDVRDVVAASIQAAESGRKGEKYILSGNFCSLKKLSSMIRDISGCRIPPAVPVSLARLACPFFEAFAAVTKRDPLYTQQSLDKLVCSPANISYEKAGKELNYRPLPIEKTLMDTFNWYRENNFLT